MRRTFPYGINYVVDSLKASTLFNHPIEFVALLKGLKDYALHQRPTVRPHLSRLNSVGFTLVELALVITVIGLLLGFGVSAWMSMKTSQQISATVTTLKTASSCLGNYVIHSGKTPPQTYFSKRCAETDPWGQSIVYYDNGENLELTDAPIKTVRDNDGDHPDGLWIVVSSGPNGIIETTSTTTIWDCSTGDDLCHFTSKNALIYETNK